MSESASFKFWGIDTRYKASLLCYVSHTADTTPLVFLAEERLYSLPLSWQIRGFPAPGLRKLYWDTPEVLVHEETFEDKTGAMAMAILRGDDGMYHLKQTQDTRYVICQNQLLSSFGG